MAQNRLTEAQNTASLHHNGPALTLAIPGSGKTTLLLHRLINLVTNYDVKPRQIMTLTFSKASADDMAQRYKSQFGHLNHHFQFMTIHKFAYAVYRNYLKQTGKSMQLLDDGAQKFHILNEIYKKRHHDTLTEDDFETLTNHIGLIYNLKLTREDLPNFNF